MTPRQNDTERLRELVWAVHRLNVDWDHLARSCEDPKCEGNCEYVATVRHIVDAVRSEEA